MKALSWIIAFLGLWEFGDIVALFVPRFGNIPSFLWNHIIVGLILMIVGVWAAKARNASAARTMNWIAIIAGLWLIIGSFILRYPVIAAGLWNDIIIGTMVLILGVWVALTSPQIAE
jgi:hypothetical protein